MCQQTRQYSFNNKMKYFIWGWLFLFRGIAVREQDVEFDTFETGSSVSNHASCIGEASVRGSTQCWVGVNQSW